MRASTLPFELFVAVRYLRAKRKQVVISIITFIAVLGVGLGVFAMIVAMAFATGVREEWQVKLLEGTAHINLLRRDGRGFEDYPAVERQLLALPRVTAAAATVYQNVLLQTPAESGAAIIKGVDCTALPDPSQANEVYRTMAEGRADALCAAAAPEEELDPLVLGKELADNLKVRVGDTVKVLSPAGRLTPEGLAPRLRSFRVMGLFKSGLSDYDSTWAYTNLDAMRRLTGTAEVAEVIQLKVSDVDAVKEISREILARLGSEYSTQDWQQLNQQLYVALNFQKTGWALLFVIIIALGALNIVTTLSMMVLEKNRDIAILLSMGTAKRSILRIFLFQGLIIGAVGTLLGVLTGVGFSLYAHHRQLIQLPQSELFGVSSFVPFKVLPTDVAIVAATALLISLTAGLYPAWKASRNRPVEGLRYE